MLAAMLLAYFSSIPHADALFLVNTNPKRTVFAGGESQIEVDWQFIEELRSNEDWIAVQPVDNICDRTTGRWLLLHEMDQCLKYSDSMVHSSGLTYRNYYCTFDTWKFNMPTEPGEYTIRLMQYNSDLASAHTTIAGCTNDGLATTGANVASQWSTSCRAASTRRTRSTASTTAC